MRCVLGFLFFGGLVLLTLLVPIGSASPADFTGLPGTGEEADDRSVISAGFSHTCGVQTDGTLACWGRNDFGQATPPRSTFIQISAGSYQQGFTVARPPACARASEPLTDLTCPG